MLQSSMAKERIPMQMSVSRREVGKSLRAVFQRMENNPLAVLLFRRRAAHRTILQCYNYHTTVKRKNVVKKSYSG